MKNPTYVPAIIMLTASLALIGAGCYQVGNQVGEAVVQPISVPLEAGKKAKQDLSDVQAKLNQQGEAFSDEVTVALILTEGSTAPTDAQIKETVGCNDQVALVKVKRAEQTDNVLSDILKSLLAVRDQVPEGLYNGLAAAKITVDKVVDQPDGTTEVRLKGQFLSGGVCDDPRIKAQLEDTIKRITKKYKIFLNGTESEYRCFGDMSGQCK